jgi:short-subunit dehydrogenase
MKSLIIGASRGIGLELAKQLNLVGYQVLATARDASGLKTLEECGVTPIALDVSQAASMDRLKDNLQGQIFDLIIYVAGVYGPKTDAKEPIGSEDFDRHTGTTSYTPNWKNGFYEQPDGFH